MWILYIVKLKASGFFLEGLLVSARLQGLGLGVREAPKLKKTSFGIGD